MNTTLKWGGVMAVVAACVGFLIYSTTGGSSEYYLTVSELRAHPQSGNVRVAGVVENDVVRSDGGLHVRFTEKDSTATLLVDYTGTLPDIFQPGITVVAEGKLGADGVFHARQILTKCPSRFSTAPVSQ